MATTMTHPLNRIWIYASDTIYKWNSDLECFEYKEDLDRYILGNRSIVKVNKNVYRMFKLDTNGHACGVGVVSSLEAGLEWLHRASYKEYGYQLWCTL